MAAVISTTNLTIDELAAMLEAGPCDVPVEQALATGATALGADLVGQIVGIVSAGLWMRKLELEGAIEPSAERDAMMQAQGTAAQSMIGALERHDRAAYTIWRKWRADVESAPKRMRAAAARKAQDAALAARGLERCDRCGGAGGWAGWPGFTCYQCHGEGGVPMRKATARSIERTRVEYEAELDSMTAPMR